MIEVHDLHKSFPSRGAAIVAVDGVSFVARDGEITGLLGPNGAGKTTTLRMLYTLMQPDAGRVLVDGRRRRRGAGRRAPRGSACCPTRAASTRASPPARTSRTSGGCTGSTPRDRGAHRAAGGGARHEATSSIAAPRASRRAQRTKVAIARALVHEPRNVLLDEPTNGLDVMTTRAMRQLPAGCAAEGRCVLFSSHIMQEVAALCDRIVVIADGRVVATARRDELRARTDESNLEDAFVVDRLGRGAARVSAGGSCCARNCSTRFATGAW